MKEKLWFLVVFLGLVFFDKKNGSIFSGSEELQNAYGIDGAGDGEDDKAKEQESDGETERQSDDDGDEGEEESGGSMDDLEIGDAEIERLEVDSGVQFSDLYAGAVGFFEDVDFGKLSNDRVVELIEQYKDSPEFEEYKKGLDSGDGEKKPKSDDSVQYNLSPEVADREVKVAGQVMKYSELVAEAAGFYPEIDFSNLSEEGIVKYTQSYINGKHFDAARASYDKKFQELNDSMKRSNEIQKEYADKIEDIELKLQKADELLERDPDDEEDYDKREDLLFDQKLAKRQKSLLEQKREELREELEEVIYQQQLDALQTIPGLHTSKHIADILDDFDKNGLKSVDKNELLIAEGLRDVLADYNQYIDNNPKSNLTILDYFDAFRTKYPQLGDGQRAKSEGQRAKGDGTNKRKAEPVDLTSLTYKESLQRILKRKDQHPGTPSGGNMRSTEFARKNAEGELTLENAGYR